MVQARPDRLGLHPVTTREENTMSTSMKGNDHVAKAKFMQEGVHEWQSGEGLTDATCIATALDALTEATLAVAHEQRMNTLAVLLSTASPITSEVEDYKEPFRPIVRELKEGTGL